MTVKVNDKLLLSLACFLCVNAFVIYFVSQERYIYFWDWAGYWYKYQDLGHLFKKDPLNALHLVVSSVRHDDYNFLPAFFLIPFNLLFGDGRLAYILSIANIFVLPTIFTFALLMEQIFARFLNKKSFSIFFFSTITVALFPPIWTPVLQGEVGVVGVLIIVFLLLMYVRGPIERQRFVNLVLIGFLLAFLVLLRRWYAYWAVSFVIVLAVDRFLNNFQQYRFSLKQYLPFARALFIIGVTALLLLFLIATPISRRMLFTNYADIYSAYQTSNSIIHIVIKAYYYFGPLSVLLFLVGVVKFTLNAGTKRVALFLIAQLATTFFLFSRTVDFGPQHYYLLIPTILIFISLFVANPFDNLKLTWNALCSIGYILIILVNFLVVFVPGASESLRSITFLLPKVRHYPLVRNDVKEINNLLDSLATLVKDNDDTIYVLSSTSILNDEILRSACRLYTHASPVCKNILLAHHVDKRDGFPLQFLTARYVVIADPIQYHLRPEDQRVVGILADEILNQRGIGLSFKALNYKFALDNNVKAYIFEKITPFRRSDLDHLSRVFLTHYPDKKELFTIDTGICGLIIKKEIGDVAGEIACQKDAVFIHPGVHTPTRLFLKLRKEYHSLKMLLAFRDPQKIPLSCRAIDGEIDLEINADGKTIFQKNIDYKHPVSYQLDIRGLDVLQIRVDKGRNGPDCDWFMLKNIEVN